MATLPGQRAEFTYCLNKYNIAEDAETRARFVEKMAQRIKIARENGFTIEQVTQGQTYPKAEVEQYLNQNDPQPSSEGDEQEAIRVVQQIVDTSEVMRLGEGLGIVYAYGYRCANDRLKIGSTENDTVQRIAAQIGTSTPDKPVLYLEIKTDNCRALERAIQATLEARGKKIVGGGAEWFITSRDEIEAIYDFIGKKPQASGSDNLTAAQPSRVAQLRSAT